MNIDPHSKRPAGIGTEGMPTQAHRIKEAIAVAGALLLVAVLQFFAH